MPSFLVSNAVNATWPVGHIAAMTSHVLSPPAKGSPTGRDVKSKGVATLLDHVSVQIASLPKFFVALAIYTYLMDINFASYAKTVSLSWVLPIFYRDLAITLVTGGVWDALLYSTWSPFYEAMKTKKFNEEYAAWFTRNKTSPIIRDVFWCIVSTVIATALEVGVLYAWATGAVALPPLGAWWTHAPTIAWLLAMPYIRITHFYLVHRFMHKWGTTSVPDVGEWMYKNVHALHHQSKNPTAFSGIAMHPVESFLYFTAELVPVYFGCHPLVFLLFKCDLSMAAIVGHSGFEFPGGGSHPHYIHHALVDCNYGENYVPLDWMFGSFAADEQDFAANVRPRFEKTKAAKKVA